MRPSSLVRVVCIVGLAACVDEAFGPGAQNPVGLQVSVTLPAATPAAWAPTGETLHVAVRRAGRVEPVVDTSVVITGALAMTFDVPLNQAVERFVATAEVRYGASLLFLAFDVVQLSAGADTAITLAARYVGPGARAVAYTLGSRDSTLLPGDTASLIPQVLDSLGQIIPNVPVRYVASRPALIAVDPSGLLSALPGLLDTATITGFLPMGLSSGLVVRVVANGVPTPRTKTWVGGAAGAETTWSNANNWSPVGEPGSGDSVVVATAAFLPVLTASDTITCLRIESGDLTLNGHTLVVLGDFSTENASGTLTMTQPLDSLRVVGNALFDGGEGASLLTAGTLIVSGDFVQPAPRPAFEASGTHRTVLDGGVPQRLSVAGGSSGARFHHLDISNTAAGIRIGGEQILTVGGKLRVLTAATIDNGSGGNGDVQLDVGDSLVMATGSRLTVVELTLGGGMAVAGAFVPQPAAQFRVRFQGSGQAIQSGLDYRDVEINGTARLTGATTFSGNLNVFGSLDMAGHPLVVTGNLHTENGNGRLIMQRAADGLEVRGNALFEGDSIAGDLTAGVLRVAGEFRQLRYSNKPQTFRASANHRTVLNGSARQDLVFEFRPTFGHLEIANTNGTVGTRGNEMQVFGTMRVSTPVLIEQTGIALEIVLALDVGDSLITVTGSTLQADRLVARGALAVGGTLTTSLIEFAGVAQAIPSQLSYRNVIVSGSARLVGRTQISAALTILGPQSSLTLDGHTLLTPYFQAGTTGVPGGGGGTLAMKQPNDSLIVAGDAYFISAATPGSLSAGVLVAGSLFQYESPEAFQPTGLHRTRIIGSPGQISFVNAGSGAGASFFRHLEIGDTAYVFLSSNVTVTGLLSGGNPTAPPVIARSNPAVPRTVSATGADIAGLSFSGVTLAVGDGLVRLDTLTFVQQDETAAQLSITHPGNVGGFNFAGLRFLTTPTSGAYITATDAAPSDGQTLTINLSSSQPADGSAQTMTAGGAIVNWLGGSVPFALVAVSGGLSFGCDLIAGGAAYCWGQNGSGQLGDGTIATRLSPVAVAGGLRFTTIEAGGGHSCALSATGAAFCWGSNAYGQIGDGTKTDRLTPVAVSGGRFFISLATGELHTCGVTAAGDAYCWGANASGQLGDGTVVDRSAPALVSGGLTLSTISAGIGSHTCALTAAGAAYCWGRNNNGALGDGTTTGRLVPTAVAGGLTFASISATGNEHSCGVTSSAVGYCWGWNPYGNLGDGTATDRLSPTAIAGGLSFSSVAAGAGGFSCGVTTAGAAYCWGINTVGQLGDGTAVFSRATPTAVTGGLTFTALRAGFSHVTAIATGGAGYSWGFTLGDGTTNRSSVPVPLGVPIP